MPLPHPRRWSTYHRVPAELVDLFDFLNTVDLRQFAHHTPSDELTDPPALALWLAERELLATGTEASQEDLELAITLRTTLRVCALAHCTGNLEPGDLPPVMEALPLHAVIQSDGGFTLTPATTGVAGALAALLAQATYASANGLWRRIKMCAADDCRIVFYDHSKPRNARWCETLSCGNRVKVQAYRQRRKTVSQHPPAPHTENSASE